MISDFLNLKSSVLFNSTPKNIYGVFISTYNIVSITYSTYSVEGIMAGMVSLICALHFQGQYKNISDRANLYKKASLAPIGSVL